jgi:hypothetical protein
LNRRARSASHGQGSSAFCVASQTAPCRHRPGVSRKPAFTKCAAGLGLVPTQFEALWAIGGGSRDDGFAPIEQRTGALYFAARVQQKGTHTLYVQLTVEGLSKPNAKMGHSQADARLADARARMRALLAGAGTLIALRERAGGFGFVIVGGQSTAAGLLQRATAAATEIGSTLGIALKADVQTAVVSRSSVTMLDRPHIRPPVLVEVVRRADR